MRGGALSFFYFELSHFVILARKIKAGIVQDDDITDLRVRTLANVLVHKKNKKRAFVVERFDKEVSYELVNISKTDVVYDTYDVAAFSLSQDKNGKYDPFRYHKKNDNG